MNKYVATLLFASICCFLMADPALGLIGFGYAPPVKHNTVIIGVPLSYIGQGKPGSLMIKVLYRDKNYPKGFETESEPYEWWDPTGREIYGSFVGSIGYMIDIPRLSGFSLTPYLGLGSRHTYTEYLSSATGWHFYNRTTKQLIDLGIDLHVYYKYAGVVIGASSYSQYHLAAFVRY
ncbi:MAG: hypothetical protein PHO37_19110 [Kiritimatiellae bacterium]|nr:hypothetical protein [Kiritimatiellia bacterium]